MKIQKAMMVVGVCAAIAAVVEWSSCGGSSSSTPAAPTVSSVTGTTLSASGSTSAATIATTGTTGVSGAASSSGALTVTFSTTMDGSTLSNATLTCGGTSQTIAVSPTTNTTAYTITPSAALPLLSSCVLTLPVTITDSAGTAMAAATYTYTTGCSTGDDFASDDLSTCWTAVANTSVGSFSVGSGRLNFALTAASGNQPPYVLKGFASSSNPIITVQVPVFTNFLTGNEGCGFSLLDSASLSGGSPTGLSASVSSETGSIVVKARDFAGGSEQFSGSLGTGTSNDAVIGGTISLRMVRTASAVDILYSLDGSNFIPVTTISTTGNASLGTSPAVTLGAEDLGTSNPTCGFDNFTVTEATAISPVYEY